MDESVLVAPPDGVEVSYEARRRDIHHRICSQDRLKMARKIVSRCASRAKKLGMECQLPIWWVHKRLEAGVCEVTGMDLDFRKSINRQRRPFSPSIERTDPKRGYTMDNCYVTVLIYNLCKNSFEHEDVVKFARALASCKDAEMLV